MDYRNDGTPTDLYLVRIWRGKSGDGPLLLHGKLQHVVSGESSYFDGLSGLPEALKKMLERELGLANSGAETILSDRSGPDGEPEES